MWTSATALLTTIISIFKQIWSAGDTCLNRVNSEKMFIFSFRIENSSVLKMNAEKIQYFSWHWNSIHCRRRRRHRQQQQPRKIHLANLFVPISSSLKREHILKCCTLWKIRSISTTTMAVTHAIKSVPTCSALLECLFPKGEENRERENVDRNSGWIWGTEQARENASVCRWFYLQRSTLHSMLL